MPGDYPSARPMGRFRSEDVGFEHNVTPSEAQLPWIDIHQHGHNTSWNDRHAIDLSGGRAVVFIGGTAGPYRPMAAEELRLLWDGTLRQSHAVSRSHFFDAYVALAVHTTRTRTENWESLVELLSEYATLDEVVAIGETGISLQTAGDADPWTLKEQRMVVGEQMRVARETGLPVLCHTPSDMKSNETAFIRSKTEGGHDHAPDAGSQAGDSLAAETAKRGATEISVQIADDVGLPDEQLVIDHASSQITPFVLESTGCYLSFSVGSTIHEVNIEAVADAIDRYGPDRILIDSDITGMAEINPFAMKEAILDLLRLGVSPADVRRVIYENPREILGLSDLPE